MGLLHRNVSDVIIKSFYNLYNELGFGFLESVYENALYYELCSNGLQPQKQVALDVYFKDQRVGEFKADLLIDEVIIIELKTEETLTRIHEAQLLNYLKATNIEVGLLLNFGKEPAFKRLVFKNNRK